MKKLIEWAVKLYPAAWRERYQSEFEALLDDVHPTMHTVWDIFKGGMAMQFRTLSGRKIVAAAGLIGVAAGLVVWLTIPNRYVSTAVLRGPTAGFPERVATRMTDQTLSSLVREYNLYAGNTSDDQIAKMRQNLVIRPVMAANAQERRPMTAAMVQFSYSNPAVAQKVTADLVAIIVMDEKTLYEVLDPASRSNSPVSPSWKPLAVIGLLCGLIAGGFANLLRRRLTPAI